MFVPGDVWYVPVPCLFRCVSGGTYSVCFVPRGELKPGQADSVHLAVPSAATKPFLVCGTVVSAFQHFPAVSAPWLCVLSRHRALDVRCPA